jgi:sulfatase modifying factor 1
MKRHASLAALMTLASSLAPAIASPGCTEVAVVGVAPAGDIVCGDHPGPTMVSVPVAGSGSFCIDTTEVTQAQYAAFLATSPALDPASATCGWKSTFAPGTEGLDENEHNLKTHCQSEDDFFNPAARPDHPVVCVDWCDASAYCAWAGKRLCGEIAGGMEDPATAGQGRETEWYSACSNGHASTFPYGDAYDSGACNGDGNDSAEPVASRDTCRGSAPPYDRVFDMVGNVAEWDTFCSPTSLPGAQSSRCLFRGGGFDSTTLDMACSPVSPAGLPGGFVGAAWANVGFRCCAD